MLSVHAKIDRTERLIRMIEQDAPFLAMRVAGLSPERQNATREYVNQITAQARAELGRLIQEESAWDDNDPAPQASD
jgi:hypothetical protein